MLRKAIIPLRMKKARTSASPIVAHSSTFVPEEDGRRGSIDDMEHSESELSILPPQEMPEASGGGVAGGQASGGQDRREGGLDLTSECA
jgi:hypothetical protein